MLAACRLTSLSDSRQDSTYRLNSSATHGFDTARGGLRPRTVAVQPSSERHPPASLFSSAWMSGPLIERRPTPRTRLDLARRAVRDTRVRMEAGARRVAPGPLAAVPGGDDPAPAGRVASGGEGRLGRTLLSFDGSSKPFSPLEHHAHLDVEPGQGPRWNRWSRGTPSACRPGRGSLARSV